MFQYRYLRELHRTSMYNIMLRYKNYHNTFVKDNIHLLYKDKHNINLFLRLFRPPSNFIVDQMLSVWQTIHLLRDKFTNAEFSNNILSLFNTKLDVINTTVQIQEELDQKFNDIDYNWFRTKGGRKFQNHLRERYSQIAYNYTDEYKKDLKKAFDNYSKARDNNGRNLSPNDPRIREALVHTLDFDNLDNTTSEEIDQMFGGSLSLADIRNLSKGRQKIILDEIKRKWGLNPNSDMVRQNGPFVNDQYLRMDRIVRTEMYAAYNIARIDDGLKQGYDKYIWHVGENEESCVLCLSLENQILNISSMSTYSMFRRYSTKKEWFAQNMSVDDFFPPVHPYCGCYLTTTGKRKKKPNPKIAAYSILAGGLLGWAANKFGIKKALRMKASVLLDEYSKEQQRTKENNLIIPVATGLATSALVTVYAMNRGAINYWIKQKLIRAMTHGKDMIDNLKDQAAKEIQEKIGEIIFDRMDIAEAKKKKKEIEQQLARRSKRNTRLTKQQVDAKLRQQQIELEAKQKELIKIRLETERALQRQDITSEEKIELAHALRQNAEPIDFRPRINLEEAELVYADLDSRSHQQLQRKAMRLEETMADIDSQITRIKLNTEELMNQ